MKHKLKLFWWIFPLFLALSAVSNVAIVYLGIQRSREFYLQQELSSLQRMVRVLSHEMVQSMNQKTSDIASLCKDYARHADMRVTIVNLEGKVLADSHHDPATMENHKDRPELISAREYGEGSSTRYSATLGTRMLYVGQRLKLENQMLLMRVALPIPQLDLEIQDSISRQVTMAMVIMFLVSLSVWWLSQRIVKPLEQITAEVRNISRGLKEEPLELRGSRELCQLTLAINLMHQHAKERIATIVQQRNQQEAMLMGMKEGVISMDKDGHIQTINPMARHMLRCSPTLELQGRSVWDIFRSSVLQDEITHLINTDIDIDIEVTLEHLSETIVQVRGCCIQSNSDRKSNYLVVLNDITHLRRLENMRRDFVANVSHELKTPLTSIKGYAETLANMKVVQDEMALRFLGKIEHNADRLHQIIEDLLILSRIEQNGLPPQDIKGHSPKSILDQLVNELTEEQRQRTLIRPIRTNKKVLVHGPLIHQALFNLIENGLKYSGVEGVVEIQVEEEGSWVAFHIRDNGPGIPAQHIPLLTQRFYRVDKDRSRAKGGTGLGLSIVKHIVDSHRGELVIDSTVGEGSTFTIRLPVSEEHLKA